MTDIRSRLKDILNNNLNSINSNGNGLCNTQSDISHKRGSLNTTIEAKLTNGSHSKAIIRMDFSLESYKKQKKSINKTDKLIYLTKGVSQSGQNSKKCFNVKQKLEELFENKYVNSTKKSTKEFLNLDFDFSLKRDLKKRQEKKTYHIGEQNLDSNHSFFNKCSDCSIYNSFHNSVKSTEKNNSRLKREIKLFSESLYVGRDGIQTSFINRPTVGIKKLETELNTKTYLEFSPIKTRKNVMVKSNLLKNFSLETHRLNKSNGGFAEVKNKKDLKHPQLNNQIPTPFRDQIKYNTMTREVNEDKLGIFKFSQKSRLHHRFNTIRGHDSSSNDSLDDFKNFDINSRKQSHFSKFAHKLKKLPH